VARQMLRSIWRILRKGEAFDPAPPAPVGNNTK
jgi:hypothetical protein